MFPVGLTSFSQIFTTQYLLIYLGIAVANAVLLYFASIKFLLVFQQCGYRHKRYFKWLVNPETPYMSRLMLLSLLGLLFFLVLSTCFAPAIGDNAVSSFIGFASYLLFTVAYINTEASVNAKIPLKKTHRLIRLAVAYIILLFAVSFGLMVLLDYIAFAIGDVTVGILRFSAVCLLPLALPYILIAASFLMEPFETVLRRHYLKVAKWKLSASDIVKIGITGSYGKTSVKEILKVILSQKFRVLSSPESYNTPLGIALTAKMLDGTHDVFIAEMGARRKGDIKELALMVKPKYGVLTGINSQHLESFGTIENIKDTKFELFEHLSSDGAGFFAGADAGARELAERFGGEKYLAGAEGDFVYATDAKVSTVGTEFILNIQGEKPIAVSTVLLGTHNIKNICLASAVAYKMGMSPELIAQGINRIQTIGHRLEIVTNNKNIAIIDDSYNSSPDGVKAAMEVLDAFTGRKIVVTPGLVELGKEEAAANLAFGKLLASHADLVIIIGKHNAVMLIDGLVDGGMSKDDIKFAKTLNRGNELLNTIMKEGDVVLFENDLPDNYN